MTHEGSAGSLRQLSIFVKDQWPCRVMCHVVRAVRKKPLVLLSRPPVRAADVSKARNDFRLLLPPGPLGGEPVLALNLARKPCYDVDVFGGALL